MMICFQGSWEPLIELVARDRVGDRDDKEDNRAKNHQQVHIKILDSSESNNCRIKKKSKQIVKFG